MKCLYYSVFQSWNKENSSICSNHFYPLAECYDIFIQGYTVFLKYLSIFKVSLDIIGQVVVVMASICHIF